MHFHVESSTDLKPGDTILIHRPSTAEWIRKLGMNETGGGIGLGWHAGTRDILWDCKITAIQGDQITIDSPITTALIQLSAAAPSRNTRGLEESVRSAWRTCAANRLSIPPIRKMKRIRGWRSHSRTHRIVLCGKSRPLTSWGRLFRFGIRARASPLKMSARSHRFPRSPVIADTHSSPTASRRCSNDVGPSRVGTILWSGAARRGRTRLCSAKPSSRWTIAGRSIAGRRACCMTMCASTETRSAFATADFKMPSPAGTRPIRCSINATPRYCNASIHRGAQLGDRMLGPIQRRRRMVFEQ